MTNGSKGPNPICSVEDCSAVARGRGWCQSHYMMWFRHGDPLAPRRIVRTPGTVCLVDVCLLEAKNRGWCVKHYAKWRRYGDPLGGLYFEGSPLERLMRRLEPETATGCWPVSGSRSAGYVKLTVYEDDGHRTMRAAHLIMYEAMVGPVPEGMHLDHLCHTNDLSCYLSEECPHRACANYTHLEVVTPSENVHRSRAPGMELSRLGRCKRGHELTLANSVVRKNGTKTCRRCSEDYRAGRVVGTDWGSHPLRV